MAQSKIAVTTDFSEESIRSFPIAASLARTFHRDLMVVHQARFPDVGQIMKLQGETHRVDEIAEKHCAALESRLSELTGEAVFHDVTVTGRLIRDWGVDFLRKCLHDEQVSLLVTSTHGYTGTKRLFLGSFAANVVRVAPCPVLVFRSDGSQGSKAAEEYRPRCILSPTDLSENSVSALDLATSWARTFAARLVLQSVIEKPTGFLGYAKNMFEGWWAHEQEARVETTARLDQIITEKCSDIDARYMIGVGDPSSELFSTLEETDADLVVMGTHGRSGFQEFFLGSVAHKLVAGAQCPVLLVPPSAK